MNIPDELVPLAVVVTVVVVALCVYEWRRIRRLSRTRWQERLQWEDEDKLKRLARIDEDHARELARREEDYSRSLLRQREEDRTCWPYERRKIPLEWFEDN